MSAIGCEAADAVPAPDPEQQKDVGWSKYFTRHNCIVAGALAVIVSLMVTAVLLVLFWPKRHALEHPSPKHVFHGACGDPVLLLVSFDGFRADYLKRALSPTIAEFIADGASAEYLVPSFPTTTFSNHYSIVTGLYPAVHGVVDNKFLDPEMGSAGVFTKSTKDPRFYSGEPIWNTLKKAGKRSAELFWPGSEVPVGGMTAGTAIPYDESLPFSERVDQVIAWLTLPEHSRPSFVTLYFHEPDFSGHRHGPDSLQVNNSIRILDATFKSLLSKMEAANMRRCVDIAIVSDHGMTTLRKEKYLALYDFPNFSRPKLHVEAATNDHIYFLEGFGNLESLDLLPELRCSRGEQFRVYSTATMPVIWHYYGKRVGDLFLTPVEGGYSFTSRFYSMLYPYEGNHGYHNLLPSMRAIFAINGPSVRRGVVVPPFLNTELYNLFADVLKLPNRAPNNGTRGLLNPMLANSTPIAKIEVVRAKKDKYFVETICATDCDLVAPEMCNHSLAVTFNPHLFQDVTYDKSCLNFVVSDVTRGRSLRQSLHSARTSTSMCDDSADNHCFTVGEDGGSAPSFDISKSVHGTTYLDTFIANLTTEYLKVVEFVGPIWDTDYDGIADVMEEVDEPTHFFAVLLYCLYEWQAFEGELHCVDPRITQTVAFVLPNVRTDDNCLSDEAYVHSHRVRVYDVEQLTGIRWFTNRHIYDRQTALLLRNQISFSAH